MTDPVEADDVRRRGEPEPSESSGRWQRRAPSIRAVVPCGDEEHVVVWRRGAIATAHHDLRGEELLVALGADRSPCLAVVRGWRAEQTDPARPPAMTFFRVGPNSAPVARMEHSKPQVLPEPLRRMRILTALGRSGDDRAFDELLEQRARAALRSSTARLKSVEVEVGGTAPAFSSRRDRPVVTLQRRWLTHVWARQLDLVEGNFAIDASARPGADGRIEVALLKPGADGLEVVIERVER